MEGKKKGRKEEMKEGKTDSNKLGRLTGCIVKKKETWTTTMYKVKYYLKICKNIYKSITSVYLFASEKRSIRRYQRVCFWSHIVIKNKGEIMEGVEGNPVM